MQAAVEVLALTKEELLLQTELVVQVAAEMVEEIQFLKTINLQQLLELLIQAAAAEEHQIVVFLIQEALEAQE